MCFGRGHKTDSGRQWAAMPRRIVALCKPVRCDSLGRCLSVDDKSCYARINGGVHTRWTVEVRVVIVHYIAGQNAGKSCYSLPKI
jgi:hypothetical protein